MLEFNIRNQEISRIDNFSPAEKSVEYLIAKFNFKTDDWNGATKRAIFRNVKSKEERDTILENDSCTVPWEVLVGSSEIEISVHGVNGTEEITTDVATCNLNRTLSGGSATQEPSPTVYEQLLETVKETKEIAQSVRDDADNGQFDGDKGDTGKSAYEYAVEGGYTGTEAEFMEGLARAGDVITKEEHEAELLKAMVKVTTEESAFHHITDSANMKVVDFGMRGKIEQRITSGKNKLKTNNLVERAISGVTFTPVYTNGMLDCVLVNGTATSTVSYPIGSCDDTYLSVDKIILNGCPSGGSASTYMLVHLSSGTADIGDGKEQICSYLNNLNYAIRIMGGTTVSNLKFYPMVRLATETDATYEPYTNGPSPNPDYEQPITLAGVYNKETGRYEHKCCVINKNLVDIPDLVEGIEINETGVNCYIPNSVNISCINNNAYNEVWLIFAERKDGSRVYITNLPYYIYVTEDNPIVHIRYRNLANRLTGSYTNIQIEISDTATDYTSHASQAFTLTSPVPLTKWDYLTKRDGVWGQSINYLHLFIDGECTNVPFIHKWMLNGSNDTAAIYSMYIKGKEYGDEILCTTHRIINSVFQNKELYGICGTVSVAEAIYVSSDILTLDEWKAHLNEKPLEVYIKTAEEQAFYPLPDEEQELLHNLEMYYGVTNVWSEQECKIKLTYAADQELHWNQKLLEIQQALI